MEPLMDVSELFDIGVDTQSNRVVVTIASEMGDTEQDGIVLRLTRTQASDLVERLTDSLHGTFDPAELKSFLGTAVWEWREDYGVWMAYHTVGGPLADILHWTCSSCRDDVGWADWTSVRKDEDGVITLHIECGHCGADYAYDAEGNELP